jgi:NADPH:quinone reductase-like Zn-dependent oxidoreductase
MKAIRLHSYGGPEKLVYEDAPDPVPGEGQVVIDVAATSVNPVDWKLRHGYIQAYYPLEMPSLIGSDVAGTISAVGRGVSGFKVGDKVFGTVPIASAFGGYAQKTLAPTGELAHIPAGLDFVQAAALPLVGTTGYNAALAAKAKSGDRVLVTGALGAVGRVAVFYAAKAGAKVFAGVRKRQLEAAASLKASTVAIDDPAALRGAGPFDAIIETTGNMEVAAAMMPRLKTGGIFAAVAGAPPTEGVDIAYVPGRGPEALLAKIADDVVRGDLVVPVARTLPMANAAAAHRTAEAGGAGKIVLVN